MISVLSRLGAGSLLRFEDWLAGGWVAVVSPALFKLGGSRGPFDPDQPVQGALRLAAVGAVLVCVAARKSPGPKGTPVRTGVNGAWIGPFTGGLLLIAIAGFVALDAPGAAVTATLAVAAAGMVAARFLLPPLGVLARRALVSPFVAVAGGMYGTVIGAVASPGDVSALKRAVVTDFHGMLVPLGFLAAFSAVYYAMLVYAPRQVADPGGAPLVWVLRYAAFLASIALGVGWLGVLGG